MAVKTVTLTTEAYEALVALKAEGESFSDVVRRLSGSQVLLSAYAGAWQGAPKAEVEKIRSQLRSSGRLTRAKLRQLSRPSAVNGEPR